MRYVAVYIDNIYLAHIRNRYVRTWQMVTCNRRWRTHTFAFHESSDRQQEHVAMVMYRLDLAASSNALNTLAPGTRVHNLVPPKSMVAFGHFSKTCIYRGGCDKRPMKKQCMCSEHRSLMASQRLAISLNLAGKCFAHPENRFSLELKALLGKYKFPHYR